MFYLDTNLRYGLKNSNLIKLEENEEMSDLTGQLESHLRISTKMMSHTSTYASDTTTKMIVQVSDGTYQKEEPVIVKIDTSCENKFKFNQKVKKTKKKFKFLISYFF